MLFCQGKTNFPFIYHEHAAPSGIGECMVNTRRHAQRERLALGARRHARKRFVPTTRCSPRADRHLLSSLQSFPFDKIKIDRTFVAGVDHNGQSQARVRAVIGLGKALNVPVIAEGVESRRRTHVLEARGLRRDPGLRHRLSIENYAELTSDRDAGEHAMVS